MSGQGPSYSSANTQADNLNVYVSNVSWKIFPHQDIKCFGSLLFEHRIRRSDCRVRGEVKAHDRFQRFSDGVGIAYCFHGLQSVQVVYQDWYGLRSMRTEEGRESQE